MTDRQSRTLHSTLLAQIDAIARTGSVRGAEARLRVSASSINRRLIRSEESLGTPLFLRGPWGLKPTAAGEVVLSHIRQTLRDADRMTRRLPELGGLRRALMLSKRAGGTPNARYVTNSVGMLKYLALTGAAVTFLGRIGVDEDSRAGRLLRVPIFGQELRNHDLRLAHRKGSALSPAAALFEEALRFALAEIAPGTARARPCRRIGGPPPCVSLPLRNTAN